MTADEIEALRLRCMIAAVRKAQAGAKTKERREREGEVLQALKEKLKKVEEKFG
jgi:hypothetical protein